MRIQVTRVAGDGSVRRGELDTADRSDGGVCEEIIAQAAQGAPPPYRAVQGMPVYQIRADETTVLVTERELAGPLRGLVQAALTR
jgi:hypothetical protein